MNETQLDEVLTLQLAFAWGGESAPDPSERRLGWWRTDLVAEFGGFALFERLTPRTFEWAAFEAVRKAARVVDARSRDVDASADDIVSLFHLGHPVDEQLDDRLLAFKASGVPVAEALPRLGALVEQPWDAGRFVDWLDPGKPPDYLREPSGLRIKGNPPSEGVERARKIVGVLATLPADYPCAHYHVSSR